jgi:glycerophosphoryl diester phosphodiesterase
MAPTLDRLPPPEGDHQQGQPWAVAHRGASHLAPENTLSALRSALARGADMVEVDVRRSADGALVLLHDESLRRTTNVAHVLPGRAPWRVADLTLPEVRGLDAGRWKSPTFTGEVVPTLEEAWDLVRRAGARLLLEVKQPADQPGIMHDVGRLLDERPGAPGQVVVQSFDSFAVLDFAMARPHVPVGLLAPVAPDDLRHVAPWASYVNPHHRRVTRDYVRAVHEHGMRCVPWTVDDPRRVRRLIDAGVDGVISNRPGVVMRVRRALVGRHPAD